MGRVVIEYPRCTPRVGPFGPFELLYVDLDESDEAKLCLFCLCPVRSEWMNAHEQALS